MIFVQIAAYRETEVLPTILDCLAKAKYKGNLSFGICWQAESEDTCLNRFLGNKQFRIDRVDWTESQGLGWARSRIQGLYQGEEYTLQLDAHHRFAEHWDAQLLAMLEQTGSAKPIITTYAGVYDLQTGKPKDEIPYKMQAMNFTSYGTITFNPHYITEWRDLTRPQRARFVSGHFFFTHGRHCEEYKYDPKIYFAGDEISLSIRSYTLGYDIFHPHRTVLWHEYTRQKRVKHWDDHVKKNQGKIDTLWHERDQISRRRIRKLLREEDNAEDIQGFDLGQVRSHQDYERYAGIDFLGRRLHRDTLKGLEPPSMYQDPQQWESCFSKQQRLRLKWNPEDIELCDDLQFIFFGVEDQNGELLFRYDAKPDSPEGRMAVSTKDVDIFSMLVPQKLIVWPFSRSRGWTKKVVFQV